MKKNNLKSSLSLSLLLFCSLLFFSVPTVANNEQPLAVSTQLLSSLLIKTKQSAPATIISLNHTILSAQITGLALKIHVEAGDSIRKGKLLAEIDCRDYIVAHKRASSVLRATQLNIEHTKKQFLRNQRLLESKMIPRELFEQAEANYLLAKAAIEPQHFEQQAAALAKTRCMITAPYAGQITRRMVQQGQLLAAGTPLFQLLQTGKTEVKAELSVTEVQQAKQATALKFTVADKSYPVEIRAVIQQVNTTSRTQEVRLALKKASKLAVGLSGRLQWQDQAGRLPAEYVMQRNGSLGVMIIKKDKAHFYPLPNAIEGQPADVSLSANTKVIKQGRYQVKQGQQVTIENTKTLK